MNMFTSRHLLRARCLVPPLRPCRGPNSAYGCKAPVRATRGDAHDGDGFQQAEDVIRRMKEQKEMPDITDHDQMRASSAENKEDPETEEEEEEEEELLRLRGFEEDFVAAKWMFDGCETFQEVIDEARRYQDLFHHMKLDGWVLGDTVDNGHMTFEREKRTGRSNANVDRHRQNWEAASPEMKERHTAEVQREDEEREGPDLTDYGLEEEEIEKMDEEEVDNQELHSIYCPKWECDGCSSIDEVVERLQGIMDGFEAEKQDGWVFDGHGAVHDGYLYICHPRRIAAWRAARAARMLEERQQ